ncbi:hypothetical protein AAHA92_14328 [Salvia divinorum]|uniref:Uncharacterized protein n=1 Tax=Salvia divinorum TaxID=28513 RepID=A0ABD1HB69_SALDI
MVRPTPVDDDCDDSRWKWFKGCLGALDGTYINVRVGRARLMREDPVEAELDAESMAIPEVADEREDVQYVDAVESTTAWNQKRLELAHHMWNNV